MALLKLISNLVVPVLAFSFPSLCEVNKTSFSLDETLLLLHLGVLTVILLWSSAGLHLLIRCLTILVLLAQILISLTPFSSTNFVEVLLSVTFLYFTCYNKRTSNWFSSAKTIFFDWLTLIVLFPATGFLDLIARTSTFGMNLGFFLGANVLGMATVKAAQFIWDSDDSKTQDQVTFIHLMKIDTGTLKRLHFIELIVCVWMTYYLFIRYLIASGVFLLDWRIGLSLGFVSTIVGYFGPIAAHAVLTPEEVNKYSDSQN